MLEPPFFSVTITWAGPAPLPDACALGGNPWLAGGSVIRIVWALRTVSFPAGTGRPPTWTEPTSGRRRDMKPVPVIRTWSPPAALPDEGVSPVTVGRLGERARPHR